VEEAGGEAQRILKEFVKPMPGTSRIKTLALSLGLSISFSSLTLAQATSAPAADPGPPVAKIGVVNIQEAIMSSNEGKKEADALQQKFGGRQTELKNLNDEVEGLKKQFQAQQTTLSEDARAAKAKAIETKTKTLQRNYDDFQTEVQQAEQEVINRIGQKMLAVLEKYANANGYAMVLDVSNPQTPVLWANQGSLITKQLVDAYNAESGIAAPPAKSSGAATPARPTPTATPKKP
jgi:Skp family chaperone for outer membrane proteins